MSDNVIAFPSGPTLREALDGPNGEKILKILSEYLLAKEGHITVEEFQRRSEEIRRAGPDDN